MSKLTVSTDKQYDVIVTHGIGELKPFVKALARGKKIAVITDDVVDGLYPHALDETLQGYEVHRLVIPHGETSKNIEQYYGLVCALARLGFSRRDTVLTFGGGVVGDLGAFVAST